MAYDYQIGGKEEKQKEKKKEKQKDSTSLKDLFLKGETIRGQKGSRIAMPDDYEPKRQKEREQTMDELKEIIEKSGKSRVTKRFFVSDLICRRFNIRPPKDNSRIKVAEEKLKESQKFMNTFDKQVLPHYQDQLLKKVKDGAMLHSKFSTGEVLMGTPEVERTGLQVMRP